jgi:hypothetical protein
MRLFFVLLCCLAIPLVANAANQDNNKKKAQTTRGQQMQKQTGKQGNQGKHYNVNNVSQPNNPSHLKGQSAAQSGDRKCSVHAASAGLLPRRNRRLARTGDPRGPG